MNHPCSAGIRTGLAEKFRPVRLKFRLLCDCLILVCILLASYQFTACSGSQEYEKEASELSVDNAEKNIADESWQIRLTGVQELSGFLSGPHNNRVSGILLRTSRDQHDQIRIESINAFMKKPSPLFRQRLIEMADDQSPNVKWYALRALGDYGDPEAAPVFINGLSNEDWLIRESSITGLLQIKDPAVLEETIPCILLALNDKNISVRIATLEHLKIRDKRLYQGISVQLMANLKKGPSILIPILKALNGYVLDRDVRGQLITLLTHSNSDIRLLALQILKEDEVLRRKAKEKRKTD